MNRSQQTPPRVIPAPNQEQEKPRTDWLAWSLQMAFGCVVGFGAGFQVARLLFRTDFISFDQMILVMAGGALCCGAFASYHGHRTWMRSSIFDAPEPPRTEPARKWSIITGSVGGLLVFLPIGIRLATVGWPSGRFSSWGFSLFILLLAGLPGFLLFDALRRGTCFWGFGTWDREETPLCFWIYVVTMALGLFCLLFGG